MVGKPKTKIIKRPQNTLGGKMVKAKYKVDKDGKLATGRPTKRTKDVESKLEEAYLYNCTDEEACAYAGISESTLNRRKDEDEKFKEQIFKWKRAYGYAIKKASYTRAINTRTRDSTEILFRIDKRYKEEKEEKNTTVTILDVARIMQERRLAREKGDDAEVIEPEKLEE